MNTRTYPNAGRRWSLDKKTFLDWWPVWTQGLAWLIIATVAWTKIIEKVNGQGGRVDLNTRDLKTLEGAMGQMQDELNEYRRDAQDSARGLARVEKGVENVHDSVNQSALQLGSQLHAMEKAIQEKDVRTQVRLTRIETVAKIEDKIGPLPTE